MPRLRIARHDDVEQAARDDVEAVAGIAGAEQHVLGGDIGAPLRNETLDQRLHLRDMLGRARLDRRRQAAERSHVLVKLLVGLLRHPPDRLVQRQIRIFLRRARVDLVVHVGDVAHVADVLGAVEMPQQPKQHIEHDGRPRVADMGEVVDGRPAHIHAHARRIERTKYPLLACQRIVEPQVHQTPFGLLAGASKHLDQENRRPQPAKVASE